MWNKQNMCSILQYNKLLHTFSSKIVFSELESTKALFCLYKSALSFRVSS